MLCGKDLYGASWIKPYLSSPVAVPPVRSPIEHLWDQHGRRDRERQNPPESLQNLRLAPFKSRRIFPKPTLKLWVDLCVVGAKLRLLREAVIHAIKFRKLKFRIMNLIRPYSVKELTGKCFFFVTVSRRTLKKTNFTYMLLFSGETWDLYVFIFQNVL